MINLSAVPSYPLSSVSKVHTRTLSCLFFLSRHVGNEVKQVFLLNHLPSHLWNWWRNTARDKKRGDGDLYFCSCAAWWILMKVSGWKRKGWFFPLSFQGNADSGQSAGSFGCHELKEMGEKRRLSKKWDLVRWLIFSWLSCVVIRTFLCGYVSFVRDGVRW